MATVAARVSVLILGLAVPGTFGAVYFVNGNTDRDQPPYGDDNRGPGAAMDANTPWLTIDRFLQLPTLADGDICYVKADYSQVAAGEAGYVSFALSPCSGKSVTIEGYRYRPGDKAQFTLRGQPNEEGCVLRADDGLSPATRLTLKNCVFDLSDLALWRDVTLIAWWGSNNQASLRLENCTCIAPADLAHGKALHADATRVRPERTLEVVTCRFEFPDSDRAVLPLTSWKRVVIDRTTLTGSTTIPWAAGVCPISGEIGQIDVRNGSVIAGWSGFKTPWSSASFPPGIAPMSFTITDSVITVSAHAIWLISQFESARVERCRITGDWGGQDREYLLGFGWMPEIHPPGEWVPNVVFRWNDIALHNSVNGGHMLYVAPRSDTGEIAYNRFLDREYGNRAIVMKGDSYSIHDNLVVAGTPLALAGGAHNVIANNTLVCNGHGEARSAIQLSADQYGNTAHDNVVCNNILDAGSGDYAIGSLDAVAQYVDPNLLTHDDDWSNRFDHNCYVAGRFGIARIQGNVAADLAALRVLWADPSRGYGGDAVSVLFPDNDQASLATDPMFANSVLGYYCLTAGSPCIDAGDNSVLPAGVSTDVTGGVRLQDDPDSPDTGFGTVPLVDIGAYEFPNVSKLPGDLTCDGQISYADIDAFVLALTNRSKYELLYARCDWNNADCNGDGEVSYADIRPFLRLFKG